MKQMSAALLALALTAAPLSAQNAPAEGSEDVEEGFSLLEEGTRLLLRGLMSEMEPALRELQGALQNLDAYHAPEVLPNGDIIIRRKAPLEPEDDSGIGPGGDVEL